MISQKSVQEILDTVRVEDIVGEFVNLKKRGINLIGLCPFHGEKTPSFNVNPGRNIYKCFGCGKGGDSVNFLMEHENLSFYEALKYIAAKYNIEIEETQLSPELINENLEKDSLYIINQFAEGYYTNQLFETDLGKSVGLGYFKQRGFREDTIKKFNLGYATADRDDLTRNAVSKGYNIELLRKIGLTTQSDNDFFRSRVIFPIHNLTGKIAAFAGRILSSESHGPKYLNSPESDIYQKSKILYGLFFAKNAIRKEDECMLVEGYTDVISLHQGGVENVVASSGTSLTPEQIRLIKRYTNNILILYDGDAAGIKAALRGIELIIEQDCNVKIVLLPDKHDPDSFIKELGHSAFLEYISQNKKDFIIFRLSLAAKEIGDDPVKKTAFVREIIQTLAKIPDTIKRSVYVKECSLQLKIDERVIINETNKLITQNITKTRQENKEKQQESYESVVAQDTDPSFTEQRNTSLTHELQEKDVVRVLIKFGHLPFSDDTVLTISQFITNNVIDIINDFDNKNCQLILNDAIDNIKLGVIHDTAYYLQHPDPIFKDTAIDVLTSQYAYSENWKKALQTQKNPEENHKNDAIQSVRILKYRKITRMCKENSEKITKLQDENEVIKLLHVQQSLQQLRAILAKELNIVIFN